MSVHATLLIDGRANATERISDPQQRREHAYLLKIAGLVFSIAAIGGERAPGLLYCSRPHRRSCRCHTRWPGYKRAVGIARGEGARRAATAPHSRSQSAQADRAEPTLIASGPNAATVPVAVLNREAQAKLRQEEALQKMILGGALAGIVVILLLYLVLK